MNLENLKKDVEKIEKKEFEEILKEILSVVKSKEAVKGFIFHNRVLTVETVRRKIKFLFDKKHGLYHAKLSN